jgi:hypothetical protein
MKKTLATLLAVLMCCSLHSQDFNTMSGDWIRLKVEHKNGDRLPNGHSLHALIRYHFTKKEVYIVGAGNTTPLTYVRTGNMLRIGPGQTLIIEDYTETALTLLEAEGNQPVRYYMIPTESFQASGRLRYPYEVINSDTVYSSASGIDPIYTGKNSFLYDIMAGFGQVTAGFDFSFVIKKDGTVGDVTINASTNPKQNKRLIQLVKKSSGKWIPATYKGKPINVRPSEKIALNNR